ncbi:hypothetical protein R3P38DRAFT_2902679 [Favolaschia claudopus]|uniref:MYND-type domain-containing protein n=1 Tax=Favolaschia claudopus TaxID=2862362 RepID=A0AAW0CMR7_9AGAR
MTPVMHHSLRLSNLDSLPVSLRRYATPAASGSFRDLERLVANLSRWHDNSQFTRCLPVFYAALDPVKLSTDSPIESDAMNNAFLSLHALRKLERKHRAVFCQLWPRIWLWIAFFDTHHPEYIIDFERTPMCLVLVEILSSFTSNDAIEELVYQTVGVRAIIMEAWLLTNHSHFEDPEGHASFSKLCDVLHDIPVDNPAHFDEILDAVDGVKGVVRLVIGSIFKLYDIKDPSLSPTTLNCLTGIMAFLGNLGNKPVFCPALVAAGGASVLTTVAAASIRSSSDDLEDLNDRQYFVLLCIEALHSIIPCYRTMQTSVAAGLVRLMIYGITFPPGDDYRGVDSYRHVLTQALPASTVYHSVLLALRDELPVVDNVRETQAFKKWDMYDDWVAFEALACDRIKFMEEIERNEQTLKACTNTDCGIILEKANFKRCSHCRNAYYCSVDCQKTDWRRGDHRTACRVALLSDLANKDLTPRNLSFMRKLLHHDINAENSVLKLPTSSHYNFQALALESTVNPLVTVVDYRKGHPSAYITDANSARAEDLHKQINWDDHIARAARSGGRIELHLIRAQHGYSDNSERLLMMPQYSESPAVHQGLLDILRRDDGVANWEAEVAKLFSRCEGILKVH